jgi:hypothetical protein
MPQLANITVKKNDGTTDVVYTGVVPSAGDKSPAVWRSNSVGAAMAFRPEFRLTSQSNANRTLRRVEGTYTYPTTATDSAGKTVVADRGFINFSAGVPQSMPDADVNEFVSQGLNLLVSTLVKDSVKTGYAPT